MNKISVVQGRAIPLPMKDVDTDLIIPAQYLTSVSREGYGENLFRRLRDSDANFPFNLEKFRGASILIVDSNFGCGSSREHAVWALQGAGIQVVIAKSFADIFYSNSGKNGLLAVTLPPKIVDSMLLAAKDGSCELTVDLEKQIVSTASGESYSFDYEAFRKHCLLNGLDDIDYILSNRERIEEFRLKQNDSRFFSTT